jgi:hypothetical protein
MINFFKRYKWQIVFSFVFVTVFYSRFLFGYKFGFYGGLLEAGKFGRIFSTDGFNIHVAQFANCYQLFLGMVFSGVDFFTANGSSQFFLRPNTTGFYPFNFLAYLTPIKNIQSLLNIQFFLSYYLPCVAAVFFSQCLGVKYFRFDYLTALFFASFYCFSTSTIVASQFPSFYLLLMWIPVVLFFALESVSLESRFVTLFVISFVYLSVLLCGYPPLALITIGLCLVFSALYVVFVNKNGSLKDSTSSLIKLMVPPLVAGIVVSPYYLAMMHYHRISGSMPRDIYIRVHMTAFQITDVLSMISYGIVNLTTIEVFSLYVGLIPILLIGFFVFSDHKSLCDEPIFKTLLKIGLPIYFLALMLSFGKGIRLSDVFYFMMPVLGKSHIYARFTLPAFFFLAIGVSVVLLLLGKKKNVVFGKWALVGLIGCFLTFSFLTYFLTPPSLQPHNFNMQILLTEIFVAAIFLIIYITSSFRWIVMSAIFLTFSMNLSYFYQCMDGVSQSYIFQNTAEENGLFDFIKAYVPPGKKLIKYENTSRAVFPYLPRNFGWFAQDRLKLSHYYGNELHMASDLTYREKFPYYGDLDMDWLMKTGCDYLFLVDADKAKYARYVEETIKAPLSDGSFIYKMKPFYNHFSVGRYEVLFSSVSVDVPGVLTMGVQGKSVDFDIGPTTKDFTFVFDMESPMADLNVRVKSSGAVTLHCVGVVREAEPVAIQNVSVDRHIVKEGDAFVISGQESEIVFRKNPTEKRPGQDDVFDNGIVRVIGGGSGADIIKDFSTDYASHVTFSSDSSVPLTVYYLLFPEHSLRLFIDNKRTSHRMASAILTDQGSIQFESGGDPEFQRGGGGQLVFTLPPGKHDVRIDYKNTALSIFHVFYVIYFLLLAVVLLPIKKALNRLRGI